MWLGSQWYIGLYKEQVHSDWQFRFKSQFLCRCSIQTSSALKCQQADIDLWLDNGHVPITWLIVSYWPYLQSSDVLKSGTDRQQWSRKWQSIKDEVDDANCWCKVMIIRIMIIRKTTENEELWLSMSFRTTALWYHVNNRPLKTSDVF